MNMTADDTIRAVVENYINSLCKTDCAQTIPHSFSETHERQMETLFSKRSFRRSHLRALRNIAACLGAVIILFAALYSFVPVIHAAVDSWIVTITNDHLEFSFDHSESRHAYVYYSPGMLPDEMVLIEETFNSERRILRYENSRFDEYMIFQHGWINEKQAESLNKKFEKGETLTLYGDVPAYYSNRSGVLSLEWYDHDTMMGFSVETNMPEYKLLWTYSYPLKAHLSEYVPTWIPEGFKKIETIETGETGRRTKTETKFSYYKQPPGLVENPHDIRFFIVAYYDYAEIKEYVVRLYDNSDSVETIYINGHKASLSYSSKADYMIIPSEEYLGTTLLWVDEENNLLFTVVGSITPEDAVQIGENIKPAE